MTDAWKAGIALALFSTWAVVFVWDAVSTHLERKRQEREWDEAMRDIERKNDAWGDE
jgi:hypothetical protein